MTEIIYTRENSPYWRLNGKQVNFYVPKEWRMNRYTVVEARSNMVVLRFGAAPFEWTVPLSTYDNFAPGDIVEIAVVKVGEVEVPANVTEFTLPTE